MGRMRLILSELIPWFCVVVVLCYSSYVDTVHKDRLDLLADWTLQATDKRFNIDDARKSFHQFADENGLEIPDDFLPFVLEYEPPPLLIKE